MTDTIPENSEPAKPLAVPLSDLLGPGSEAKKRLHADSSGITLTTSTANASSQSSTVTAHKGKRGTTKVASAKSPAALSGN